MIKPDYELYRQSVSITNTQMTQALHRVFPNYTKITASMVNQPQKYGLCLLPEAEDYLASVFGPGTGLAWVEWVKQRLRQKRDDHRKKGHRITVWMNSDLYFALISLKTDPEYSTFQALAEAALSQFIEREKMKRSEIIEEVPCDG